jgi:hypothetical protein
LTGVALLLFGIGREIYFRLPALPGVARVMHKWERSRRGGRKNHFLLCGLVEDAKVRTAEAHLIVNDQTWNNTPVGAEIPVRYVPGKYDNLKPVGKDYWNGFIQAGLVLTIVWLFLFFVHPIRLFPGEELPV